MSGSYFSQSFHPANKLGHVGSPFIDSASIYQTNTQKAKHPVIDFTQQTKPLQKTPKAIFSSEQRVKLTGLKDPDSPLNRFLEENNRL